MVLEDGDLLVRSDERGDPRAFGVVEDGACSKQMIPSCQPLTLRSAPSASRGLTSEGDQDLVVVVSAGVLRDHVELTSKTRERCTHHQRPTRPT